MGELIGEPCPLFAAYAHAHDERPRQQALARLQSSYEQVAYLGTSGRRAGEEPAQLYFTPARGIAGFRESLPYVMAYVELAEGLKVLTNLVECKPDEVRIGMPVEAVFEDATPEVTLLKFRPAR